MRNSFFLSFSNRNFNKIHCFCNPVVFFLILCLLHLNTSFLEWCTDFSRWPAGPNPPKQKTNNNKTPKMVRILPLRSKRREKAEILLIKFPNFIVLLLAKKSRCSLMNTLMYNLKINFRVMMASTTSEQSPFCVAGQRSAGPYTSADARDLNAGAGKITSQKAIEEARFLSGDDYFDRY